VPVRNGLEFIKQLPEVANAKDMPVVMITTEGSEAHLVQAVSGGARGYIRKPFAGSREGTRCPGSGRQIMKSATEMHTTSGSHASWIPLLEVATREVFELMLDCKLTGPPTTEETDMDVTAMVGLAGQLCGVLSVRCEGRAAALMTSKMLGVELHKVVSEELSDALGEICNMVAGNFKNKISGLSEGCMLSPPTVITGNDYTLYSQADSPGLEVRLLFEDMPMIVSLQIQS
jgi:chemotaxis protein CheX